MQKDGKKEFFIFLKRIEAALEWCLGGMKYPKNRQYIARCMDACEAVTSFAICLFFQVLMPTELCQ